MPKKEPGVNGGLDSNYRILVQLREEKHSEVMGKLRKIEDLLIDVSCRISKMELKQMK